MPSNSPGRTFLDAVKDALHIGRSGSEQSHAQDDGNQSNDRNKYFGVPYAGSSKSDQIHPKEDTGINLQRPPASGRASQNRHTIAKSEDEKRLTGDYENPPDATRIMKPKAPNPHLSSMSRSGRMINSPVTPRNTLANTPFNPYSGHSQRTYGSQNGSGKRQRSDETKISDLQSSIRDGKVTKKRNKGVSTHANPSRKPEMVIVDDDDVQIQHTTTRVSPKQADVSFSTGDTSTESKFKGGSRLSVPEYAKLEEMMSAKRTSLPATQGLKRGKDASFETVRDLRRQDISPYFPRNVSSIELDAVNTKASPPETTQVQAGNHKETGTSKESTRDKNCTSKSNVRRVQDSEEVDLEQTAQLVSGKGSGFLGGAEKGRIRKQHPSHTLHARGQPLLSATTARQLPRASRSDDGSAATDSPDELSGENTLGLLRVSPLSSPTASASRLSTAHRSPSSSGRGFDLPHSDIRPTQFTTSRRTNAGKGTVGKASTSSNRDWIGSLRYCRAFGEAFGSAEADVRCYLRLVCERKEARIESQESNSEEITLATISLQKVVRITCSGGGSKLCLHLSGNPAPRDPVLLDFVSCDKAAECVQRIQDLESPIKVKKMESASVDQIFQRQLESQPSSSGVNHESVSQANDPKPPKRKSGEDEATFSKRQRMDPESADSSKEEVSAKPPMAGKSENPVQPSEASPRPLEAASRTPRTRSKVQKDSKDGRSASPNSKIRAELKSRLKSYKERGPWKKPLVYPPDGPKKATVDFDDLDRLDDEQFLNDNLISFYLRYLEYQTEMNHPQVARCVYFFNTYFYASLTNTGGGRGRINYDAVKRWTSKVDIFNYEFLIVPINESAHWYTAIIVNLPNLKRELCHDSNEEPDRESVTVIPDTTAAKSQPELEPTDLPNSSQSDSSGFRANLNRTEKQVAHLSLSENGEASPRNEISDIQLVPAPRGAVDRGEEGRSSPISHENISNSQEGSRGLRSRQITRQEPVSGQTALAKNAIKNKKAKSASLAKDTTVPRIITLDSLNLPHNPTIRNLQSYLTEEGKDKRELEARVDQGTKAKGIPTQNNWCDCGLFLLGYIAKFLQDPRQFVNKIINEEYKRHDQHEHWPEMNALRMRLQILELIIRLHKEQRDAQKETAKAKGKYRSKNDSRAFARESSPVTEASTPQHMSEQQNGGYDVSIGANCSHDDLRLDNPAVSKPSPPALADDEAVLLSPDAHGDTQESLIITGVSAAENSSTKKRDRRLQNNQRPKGSHSAVEVQRAPSPAPSISESTIRSSPRSRQQTHRMRVVIPNSQGSN